MAPLVECRHLASEACPAFAHGCPYAISDCVVSWLKDKKPVEAGACPAFDMGCPFKEVRDLVALRDELQKLPASHGGKAAADADVASTAIAGPAHTALVEMLQLVHKASQSVKESVGSDCPVFQAACPFKNCVTSAGVPLVLELESRSWGAFVNDTHSAVESEVEAEAEAEAEVASTLRPVTGSLAPAIPAAQAPSAAGVAVATAGVAAAGVAAAASPQPGASAPSPAAAGALEEDDDGVGLARKLKLGTTEAHKAAETVHFVREFIKGKVPRDVYAQMVVNLYYVYEAMEEALEAHVEHQLIEDLHFPDELNRAETLAKDAAFFLGGDWRELVQPSAVTTEYVARLREVAASSPELLIPHAYTRYLGDLSGGQLLRRAAVRGLKLEDDGSGVQFYIFRRVRDHKKFKNMYRARLDNLPADVAMADRMVDEANLAFGFNTRMFQELDKLMGFDVPAEPLPAPARRQQPVSPGMASAAAAVATGAACPFAALAASGVPMPMDHPTVGDAAADRAALKKQPVASAAKAAAAPAAAAGSAALLRRLGHPAVLGVTVCAAWAVAVAWQFGFLGA